MISKALLGRIRDVLANEGIDTSVSSSLGVGDIVRIKYHADQISGLQKSFFNGLCAGLDLAGRKVEMINLGSASSSEAVRPPWNSRKVMRLFRKYFATVKVTVRKVEIDDQAETITLIGLKFSGEVTCSEQEFIAQMNQCMRAFDNAMLYKVKIPGNTTSLTRTSDQAGTV